VPSISTECKPPKIPDIAMSAGDEYLAFVLVYVGHCHNLEEKKQRRRMSLIYISPSEPYYDTVKLPCIIDVEHCMEKLESRDRNNSFQEISFEATQLEILT
jgi:hypothetical protein